MARTRGQGPGARGQYRVAIFAAALLIASLIGLLAADNSIGTVQQLVVFVKSAIQLKQSDPEVAAYVKTIKLRERLEEKTVEELQGLGAGAKTVAALRELTVKTASLAAAAAPVPVAVKPVVRVIAPPSSEEQAALLAEIRENAINYTNSLPNYICSRVTRRHYDPTGSESWRQIDQIHEQLTFFDHEEKYKVVSVSGHLITGKLDHSQVGGATSSGEFGTLLYEVFVPETDTYFEWDHWGKLRGKVMYVFAFRVRQSRSKYSIYHQESRRKVIAGYRGLVYADKETKQVMRLTLECEDLPVDYPIQQVAITLDYEPTMISEREFLLPFKSELHSREGRIMVWNETEFRNYRRYSADTNITFEATPDPISADDLKETPVKPDAKPDDTKKKQNKQ